MTATKLFPYATLVAVMLQSLALAGEVRISFLNGTNELRETIDLLVTNGCTPQGLEVFQRSLGHYYSLPFVFDYSRFPRAREGFYSFKGAKELVRALPQRPSQTPHTWTFNCFDTMIALASDQMRIGIQPDDNFGPFIVSAMTTNGEIVVPKATARDAFTAMVEHTSFSVEELQAVFPESMRNARICLNAGLFCWHLLPSSACEENLQAMVMDALQASWRYQALRFPQRFEIVLCHKADVEAHTICTTHAGVLFCRGKSYTYIEKAGGQGPFVRLDVDDRSDLLPWLSAVFDEKEHRFAHLFATFNDSSIENLDSR